MLLAQETIVAITEQIVQCKTILKLTWKIFSYILGYEVKF